MLRFRTITGHLFLYALAFAVPILLMSSFIGWAYIRQENQRVESLAERQAAQVVSAIDNRLDAYRSMLNVLSGSLDVLQGNMEEVHYRLEQYLLTETAWAGVGLRELLATELKLIGMGRIWQQI
jgi:hypothetical protein